jgi:hypothetical protein
MNTIKVLTLGLFSLFAISQAGAQEVVKQKSIEGPPPNNENNFKEVRHKDKEGYGKMKTKSYSGYMDYYDTRFYWDRDYGLWYSIDKNGQRVYYERRFQPY